MNDRLCVQEGAEGSLPLYEELATQALHIMVGKSLALKLRKLKVGLEKKYQQNIHNPEKKYRNN